MQNVTAPTDSNSHSVSGVVPPDVLIARANALVPEILEAARPELGC